MSKKAVQNFDEYVINKPINSDNWLKEDIDKYIKAVYSSISKVPQREDGILDLSEIWINSSLPIDLIVEVINKKGIPEDLGFDKVIYLEKVIWSRKAQGGENDDI